MDIKLLRPKLSTIPLPIRSWFASEEVSSMIRDINKKFGIQSETIIPDLLFRFEAKDLEANYFTAEVSLQLKIDREKALKICSEIKNIILNPIKKDFSDTGIDISLLDKFQMPPAKGISDTAPKIIEDIGTGQTTPSRPVVAPRPQLAPQLQPIAISSEPIKEVPLPVNKLAPSNPAISMSSPTAKPVFSAPQGGAINQSVAPKTSIAGNSNNSGTTGAAQTSSSKPTTTSDIGWSKTQTAAPVVKLDIFPAQPPAPAPKQVTGSGASPFTGQSSNQAASSTPTTPITPARPATSSGAMGEFERLNAMKKSPLVGITPTGSPLIGTPLPQVLATAPATPAAATSPLSTTMPASPAKPAAAAAIPTSPAPAKADPAPMMLHEDTTFKAGDKSAGFRLEKPGSSAEISLGTTRPTAATRPAVIEFSGSSVPVPKPPTPTTTNAMHYTQFKPSLSTIPTADSGPRNVSQIVPPAPVAPTPIPPPINTPIPTTPVPRPPQPPMPSTSTNVAKPAKPTPPSTDKVIVKDFL